MATQQTVSAPNATPAPFDRRRTVALLGGAILVGVMTIGVLFSGQAAVHTQIASPGHADGLREFRREEIGADAGVTRAPDAIREQRRGEIGADTP